MCLPCFQGCNRSSLRGDSTKKKIILLRIKISCERTCGCLQSYYIASLLLHLFQSRCFAMVLFGDVLFQLKFTYLVVRVGSLQASVSHMTFAFWSLDTKQLNHQIKPWKNHWLWLVVLWMLELFDVPVEVIGTTVSSSLHVFLIQLNRTNPSPPRNPQIHGHLSFGSASLHSGFPSFSVARKLWSANRLAGEGFGAFLKYDISTFPPEKNCCCCASGKIFLCLSLINISQAWGGNMLEHRSVYREKPRAKQSNF